MKTPMDGQEGMGGKGDILFCASCAYFIRLILLIGGFASS